ncbi:SGNH/GDSL hydrolase family protein [Polaribacter uvawellassae]|uniref:SGNH/GDSL hydrolase family protein n=1 Tax=Polaribacter uvawellassae TaxID=3133495 RepID=UPI00321AB031
MKHVFKFFLFTFLWLNSIISFAQKDTLKVLFVGNSYTYYSNLPKMVSDLSKNSSTFIKTRMSAIGGARLKYHYNNERGLKTKELIKNGDFDIVVLQEQSMGTLSNKQEFHFYSKKLSDLIKKKGAKPYFFTTWSREKAPETQKIITNVYKEAAEQNNGVAVLVGEAWKLAKKKQPSIKLYTKDGSHPNSLGTLLTASVFLKKLIGLLPSKIDNTRKLDFSSLEFCFQIANQF